MSLVLPLTDLGARFANRLDETALHRMLKIIFVGAITLVMGWCGDAMPVLRHPC